MNRKYTTGGLKQLSKVIHRNLQGYTVVARGSRMQRQSGDKAQSLPSHSSRNLKLTRSHSYIFCACRGDASPPSSSRYHPWLKECSGKRGTSDRRSEPLIRTTLCVVPPFPISCVLHIRSETAFDEYLQRDLRLIKSANLARYVILSLVIWEFNSLIGGAGGTCGVYQADLLQISKLK